MASPEDIYIYSILKEDKKSDETNEGNLESQLVADKYGRFEKMSYLEQVSKRVVLLGDEDMLYRFAYHMGPVIWHLINNDEKLLQRVEEGWSVRSIITGIEDMKKASDGTTVFPVVQWLKPDSIRETSLRRKFYEKNLRSKGVTYILGQCGPFPVAHMAVFVPVDKSDMFGDIKFEVTKGFQKPSPQPEYCDHCKNSVQNVRLCGVCLYANYCDRSCQTAGWKKHKHVCKQIRWIMGQV